MAAGEVEQNRTTWPIVYTRRRRTRPATGTGFAWTVFLVFGVPFAMMAVLTTLALDGIYVDLLRPLWQPWPPDLLKPFLGLAVFVVTLAHLTYRVGQRRGFRVGTRARNGG